MEPAEAAIGVVAYKLPTSPENDGVADWLPVKRFPELKMELAEIAAGFELGFGASRLFQRPAEPPKSP